MEPGVILAFPLGFFPIVKKQVVEQTGSGGAFRVKPEAAAKQKTVIRDAYAVLKAVEGLVLGVVLQMLNKLLVHQPIYCVQKLGGAGSLLIPKEYL